MNKKPHPRGVRYPLASTSREGVLSEEFFDELVHQLITVSVPEYILVHLLDHLGDECIK